MTDEKFTIKDTLVRDHIRGYSYQLNTRIDATNLAETLNNYETTIQHLQKQIQHNNNYDDLRKQVIALQMDISNCQADLNKIKELIQ